MATQVDEDFLFPCLPTDKWFLTFGGNLVKAVYLPVEMR